MDFIKRFNGNLEISNLKTIRQGTYKSILKIFEDENLYFVAGGSKKNTRIEDNDIVEKNYFVIDLDIFDLAKETINYELSQEEITELGKDLLLILDQDKFFNDYSLVVNSGYGIHIYYTSKTSLIIPVNITPKLYSCALKRILIQFKSIIKENNLQDYFEPDNACTNISRIMRLPGSYNYKNKDGQGRRQCYVIKEVDRDSCLVDKLPSLGLAEYNKMEEERQTAALIARQKVSSYDSGNTEDFWLWIEANIPVEELLIGNYAEFSRHKVSTLGHKVNFYYNDDKNFCAFWVNKQKNLLLNGGSRHFTRQKGYGPFDFIKHEVLGTSDNCKVFEYFKGLIN